MDENKLRQEKASAAEEALADVATSKSCARYADSEIDVVAMSNAAREAAHNDESKAAAIFCRNLIDALSEMNGDEIAKHLVSLEATPFYDERRVDTDLTLRFTYFVSDGDTALSDAENDPKV